MRIHQTCAGNVYQLTSPLGPSSARACCEPAGSPAAVGASRSHSAPAAAPPAGSAGWPAPAPSRDTYKCTRHAPADGRASQDTVSDDGVFLLM